MGRIKAREGLVSFIFQREFNKDENDSLQLFVENFEYTEEETKFIVESSVMLLENLSVIDDIIESNLNKWSMDRLFKIDLSILRVAVFELLYNKDTAKEIVINEAVEIAKKFGTEESPKFVNGILGSLIRSEKISLNWSGFFY